MKKLSVGDSVKFKDGRTGIVEDYDDKYFYIKDSNANSVKVLKDRNRLAYEYEPEPEEEYESKEDRKKRHESLIEKNKMMKEIEEEVTRHDSKLGEMIDFCKESCEKTVQNFKSRLSEYKEKTKDALLTNGFEIKNNTINTEGYIKQYIDATDFYEVVDEPSYNMFSDDEYNLETEDYSITISSGIEYIDMAKGVFEFMPFINIYFNSSVPSAEYDLKMICNELGITEGIEETHADGYATKYKAGPFSLFE